MPKPDPRPPEPAKLADSLERLAKLLRDHGNHNRDRTACGCVVCLARLLAARGWPSSTLRSRGSGGQLIDRDHPEDGSVQLTSVEAAALDHPRLADADQRLANLLHLNWMASGATEVLVADIVARANAEGLRPLPTGAGKCGACDHYAAGTVTDRLRSGYCDACRKAWERAGRPDRFRFERDRREQIDAARDGDTQRRRSTA